MSQTRKPTHPGPWWLWVTAWSFQGVGILVVNQFEIEGWFLELALMGCIAAVPLVALYLYLLKNCGPGSGPTA